MGQTGGGSTGEERESEQNLLERSEGESTNETLAIRWRCRRKTVFWGPRSV
jgi:hypothetical protein